LRRYAPDGTLAWAVPGASLQYLAAHPLGGVVGTGNVATPNGVEVRVERYDASGSRLWSASYEHPGSANAPAALVVDRAGNTLVLIGETACLRFTCITLWRLLKYDGNGSLGWAQPIEPAPSAIVLSLVNLAVDAVGSIYVSGRGHVSGGFGLDLYKYDSAGAPVWSRRWQAPGAAVAIPGAMTVDGAGNLVLTGFTRADAFVSGGGDFATLKYDPSGNLLWARVRDESGADDRASGVAVDAAGNVAVTGLSVVGASYRILNISYDPAGNEEWSRVHPVGTLAGMPRVTTSLEGALTVAGDLWNGTDFDLLLLRYDPSGTLEWSWTQPGEAGQNDHPSGIAQDASGAVSVIGTRWNDETGSDAILAHFEGEPVPRQLHTVSPCRFLDSREAALGGPAPLAALEVRTVKATGTCGVPASARAVSANVTVTGATSPGNLRVFAGGFPPPSASSANYLPGQTRANNLVLGLGLDGRLGLLASQASGSVHVILDFNGYFE
jgi:hypothetical protein